MDKEARILIAGANGMVGAAICRALQAQNYSKLLTPSHAECDFENHSSTAAFFRENKPEYVFVAAAKVGGIHANNTYPAEFIYRNLMIQTHLIHEAWVHRVDKLLFLGSTCIYPKHASQPMQEDALLSGKLEPTNEPYAVAKIAGIKLCEAYNRQYGSDFRSLMPTNLYGRGDNFHLQDSHVLPAMMRRLHEAKLSKRHTVTFWGSGNPSRDFMCVDDLASAAIFVMNLPQERLYEVVTPTNSHLNVGSGEEVSIKELAGILKRIVGYAGELAWDMTMPDGTPRKVTDISNLRHLGWNPVIGLEQGIQAVYEWYQEHEPELRT